MTLTRKLKNISWRSVAELFLGRGAAGLGLLGLNSLLNPRLFAQDASSHGVINPLHHAAKASAIMFPSTSGRAAPWTVRRQPKLLRDQAGMPESFTQGPTDRATARPEAHVLRNAVRLPKFGKSGMEICELFLQHRHVADDVLQSGAPLDRADPSRPGHTIMHTGSIIPRVGRAWVRGCSRARRDAHDLPIRGAPRRQGRTDASHRAAQWSAGLLPTSFRASN